MTMAEEKRIYCIVAQTVQAPLDETNVRNAITRQIVSKLSSVEGTRTIVQPAGRLIAQAAHVVSKTRLQMLVNEMLYKSPTLPRGKSTVDKLKAFDFQPFQPVTTIVLSARDSFELNHVLNLHNSAKVPTHAFYDSNQPDYGDLLREVMTAIATEPVTPGDVVGILDYLPLWKP